VLGQAVAKVAFVEWKRDGFMRHPEFVAVRTDKQSIAVDDGTTKCRSEVIIFLPADRLLSSAEGSAN
jgi:hypothetical protein